MISAFCCFPPEKKAAVHSQIRREWTGLRPLHACPNLRRAHKILGKEGKHTQTNKQTNKQTIKQTNKQTNTHTHTCTHTHTGNREVTVQVTLTCYSRPGQVASCSHSNKGIHPLGGSQTELRFPAMPGSSIWPRLPLGA